MQKSLDCHLEKKKTLKAACPWNKRCRRKDEEEARWISICIKRFDEKKVFFTDLCDVAIFSDELDKGGGGEELGGIPLMQQLQSHDIFHLSTFGLGREKEKRGRKKLNLTWSSNRRVAFFRLFKERISFAFKSLSKPSLAKFSFFFRRPSFVARAGRWDNNKILLSCDLSSLLRRRMRRRHGDQRTTLMLMTQACAMCMSHEGTSSQWRGWTNHFFLFASKKFKSKSFTNISRINWQFFEIAFASTLFPIYRKRGKGGGCLLDKFHGRTHRQVEKDYQTFFFFPFSVIASCCESPYERRGRRRISRCVGRAYMGKHGLWGRREEGRLFMFASPRIPHTKNA